MPRRIRNLKNMEIDEISLVDKGANQHAMITIAKRGYRGGSDARSLQRGRKSIDENALEDGDIVYDVQGNAYEFEADEEGGEELEQEEAREGELVGKSADVVATGAKNATPRFQLRTSDCRACESRRARWNSGKNRNVRRATYAALACCCRCYWLRTLEVLLR